MRNSIAFAVLSLALTTTAAVQAGGDDLFSKVRLNSTSGSPSQPTAPAGRSEQGRTVSGVNTLQAVLLAAGYSARIDDTEAIVITLSRSDWTADLRMTLTDGGRQLRLALQLTEPNANTVLGPKTLREMLEANRSNDAAAFAISADSQGIELIRLMANAGLTSDQLKADLDAMADMAESTKSIWKTSGIRLRKSESQTLPTKTTTTTPATTPATTTQLSLDGKWISTPTTNEAFALQLNADGTFRLVHVKGTASTKSKGNFTIEGTTLTLKGDDGTTITGTVTKQTKQFVLKLGNSSTLTFKSTS